MHLTRLEHSLVILCQGAQQNRRVIAFATVAVLALFFAGPSMLMLSVQEANAQQTSSTSLTMGVLAIPYFAPTDPSWNTIYEQADAHPGTIKYAIINPCSGPCSEPLSEDWQDVIMNLQNRGIITLGYIYYTENSIANIDYYMKVPEVKTDGIFFDKEGSRDNLADFMQYSDHIHELGGIVFINPGYNYPPVISYLDSGAADVANIYESGLKRLFQMSVPAGVSPEKLSAIIKSVNKDADLQKAISQVAEKGIGNIYVTSRSYIELPPYFDKEVKIAASTAVQ